MSSLSGLSTYTQLVDVLDKLPLILREARRQRRMSLRQVASEVGCSFSTVDRIEKGNGGNLSNAVLILLWLDGS